MARLLHDNKNSITKPHLSTIAAELHTVYISGKTFPNFTEAVNYWTTHSSSLL